WIRMREHEARHAKGQCRLADALRTANQPGMRDTARAIGIEQRVLRIAMTEQHGCLTRMFDAIIICIIGSALHRPRSSISSGGIVGSSLRDTAAQTSLATLSGFCPASMRTQRSGSPIAS